MIEEQNLEIILLLRNIDKTLTQINEREREKNIKKLEAKHIVDIKVTRQGKGKK